MAAATNGTALVAGAWSGTGAVYADRPARRGHGLVIVARHRKRLEGLAGRLQDATGRSITVAVADLNDTWDLARVEAMLRTDTSITALVNNAGIGAAIPLLGPDIDGMEAMRQRPMPNPSRRVPAERYRVSATA
ncbi:MAG TPA: SDR family NAD(P)-dependent oxidoreductase [Acetobacteraceae bacterium]|nr:SDR family NAD(P)-dependent oxidoreductase [Acetobacteraceae bacterium]